MKIEFEPRGTVSVVIIKGSVDSQTAEIVLSELTAHVDAGHIQLVADLPNNALEAIQRIYRGDLTRD